jgi:hypothetical protein
MSRPRRSRQPWNGIEAVVGVLRRVVDGSPHPSLSGPPARRPSNHLNLESLIWLEEFIKGHEVR